MATHTTCDTCGFDMVDSHLKITVSVTGALRLRDGSHYDLCPTCWDTGHSAMTARAAGAVKAVADFVAQRQRNLPPDRPQDNATVWHDPEHEFGGECTTCGEDYNLNSVDFMKLYSTIDANAGERVFYNPAPPCGHPQNGLTVTVNASGCVSDIAYKDPNRRENQ